LITQSQALQNIIYKNISSTVHQSVFYISILAFLKVYWSIHNYHHVGESWFIGRYISLCWRVLFHWSKHIIVSASLKFID